MQDHVAIASLGFALLSSLGTLVAALMVARERAARAELRNDLQAWAVKELAALDRRREELRDLIETEFVCRNDLALIQKADANKDDSFEVRLRATHDFCNELKGNVLPTIAAKIGVELKWKS